MRPQVTTWRSGPVSDPVSGPVSGPAGRPDTRLKRRGFVALALAGGFAGLMAKPFAAFAQTVSKQRFEIMTAKAAHAGAATGEIILVDIRRPDEWADTGIGEGAIALDMREEGFVASLVRLRQTYPDRSIALICRTGRRSGYVISTLAAQGFPGLADVSEGMAGSAAGIGWIRSGLPVYAGTEAEIAPRLAAVMNP